VFGVPCILNEPYDLDVGKYAVFTWYGCDVVLTGVPNVPKPSSSSPLVSAYVTEDQNFSMLAAVNVHGRLEQARENALASQGRGPVVVIVGPTDTGKSTLSRILCAYAARRNKRPIMVDLDPGQSDLAPPGALAANPVDVENLSVEDGLSTGGALVYYYGFASPGEAPDYYKKCVEKLASTIEARWAMDPSRRASGCIVNTCGWVEGEGYNLLVHAIETFKADVVLVMGQDLLLNKVKKSLPESCVVIKLPVSGGATVRNREFRKQSRDRKIRDYFNGARIAGVSLTPTSQDISFDDVVILRIPNKEDIAEEGIRPVGKASAIDPNRARPVTLDGSLEHCLLGISHAQSEADVLHKNVAGFVHVQRVDVATRTLTLLCPQKGPLPGKYLVMGGIKWIDASGS